MSTGTRIPLAEADEVAAEIVGLLGPSCERIEIAGSIRRRRSGVGDVEIVAIPHYGPAPTDLFGRAVDDRPDFLHETCEALLHEPYSKLSFRYSADGRKAWGHRLKWCFYDRSRLRDGTFKSYPLDIYSTTPEQWGVTLAIRTGPADFSRRLVTPRNQGGLCPSYCQFKGWRVRHRGAGRELETPEERDVFEALGLDWIEPEDRR